MREASGLGPKALALTCGLGSSHVHMIETGDVQCPDLATIEKIAKTTGVPVSWLAFGEGPAPAPEGIAAVAVPANNARRARMVAARLGSSPTANDFTGPVDREDDDSPGATAQIYPDLSTGTGR